MKATELMIGDWVCYDGDTDYSYPIKIEGMDVSCDFCITSDRDDVGFEGVVPIPLTTEILEKNGFICLDDGGIQYEWYNWALKDTDFSFDFFNEDGDVCIANCNVEFKYVHELQHALRLCGLNELADGFRIG